MKPGPVHHCSSACSHTPASSSSTTTTNTVPTPTVETSSRTSLPKATKGAPFSLKLLALAVISFAVTVLVGPQPTAGFIGPMNNPNPVAPSFGPMPFIGPMENPNPISPFQGLVPYVGPTANPVRPSFGPMPFIGPMENPARTSLNPGKSVSSASVQADNTQKNTVIEDKWSRYYIPPMK